MILFYFQAMAEYNIIVGDTVTKVVKRVGGGKKSILP